MDWILHDYKSKEPIVLNVCGISDTLYYFYYLFVGAICIFTLHITLRKVFRWYITTNTSKADNSLIRTENHHPSMPIIVKKPLSTPLVNSCHRRELQSTNQLPNSKANRGMLKRLSSYGGDSDLTVTMNWLSQLERVVYALEAEIQDIYDLLPHLLVEGARTWFERRINTLGDFASWQEFREEILKIFVGPEWKANLERKFASMVQRDDENGTRYILKVWKIAKQIDPDYQEKLILAKVANSLKRTLWISIPRDEKKTFENLLSIITYYEEELYYKHPKKEHYCQEIKNQNKITRSLPGPQEERKNAITTTRDMPAKKMPALNVENLDTIPTNEKQIGCKGVTT